MHHDYGVRPTIKDRRPVIGFHPAHPQLGYFNGFGTKGVSLAPYFARQMADLLTNTIRAVHPEVDIRRFL
jgi:glycine/D-amino acid oxidase-like deaminating enzyme